MAVTNGGYAIAYAVDAVLFTVGLYAATRLPAMPPLNSIGRPGLGSTSPEGDKFYLPVEDSGEVVVIDTRDRRQVSTISVGGAPVRAVLAAGYGICH